MARTRAAAIQQRALAQESDDSTQAREAYREIIAEEQKMLKTARHDVLASLVIAAELAPAMRVLAQQTAKKMEAGNISPKDAMMLMSRHTQLVGKAVAAADAIVKLGRLDRNESTSNIAVAMDVELTYEEAVAELEAAGDLLAIVRNRAPEVRP